MLKSLLKNQRGQLAIFVALIFQVLFLFFAMVINVGLLVHHKINLQNSVDLAAYYAASKQAELLNAIGHMNYQIRQSYKLLAFRYEIPGSAGLINHPIAELAGVDPSSGSQYKLWTGPNPEVDTPVQEYAPIFCVNYKPTWANAPVGQNACRDTLATMITGIQIPPVIAGHTSLNAAVQSNAQALQIAQTQSANFVGPANFWMASMARIGHRADNKNRREIIAQIANSMSSTTGDFYDLDGQSVATGAFKTFKKNLTYASLDAMESNQGNFQLYNSLAHQSCGSTGIPNKPPKWLSEILNYTALAYVDYFVQSPDYGTNLEFLPKPPRDLPANPGYNPFIIPYIPYVEDSQPSYNWYDSLGVEKNPWCIAYVGIDATTIPKLPFMPINMNLEIKARAFAKPFGGRIGPWFTKTWARSSDRSSGDQTNPAERVDNIVAPRDMGNGTIPDPSDVRRYPNYSRYPGDEAGLRSYQLQRHMGKPVFLTVNLNWQNWGWSGSDVNDINQNPAGEVLSYGTDSTTKWKELRYYETSAIAPDIFDITYYSIEPNYAEVYLPRLTNLMAALGSNVPLRGDLGWRKNDPAYNKYSVKDQISDTLNPNWSPPIPMWDWSRVYHTVLPTDPLDSLSGWQKLLTSWTESSLLDYSLAVSKSNSGQQYFAKCLATPDDGKPKTQGNCIAGGRTGYSVKLVNEMFLNSNIPDLGGQGQSGPILNPPPENF